MSHPHSRRLAISAQVTVLLPGLAVLIFLIGITVCTGIGGLLTYVGSTVSEPGDLLFNMSIANSQGRAAQSTGNRVAFFRLTTT